METEFDELGQVLEQLGDETKPISFSGLYLLSDLHGVQLQQFVTTWETLSPDRRRRLVHSLVDLGEASFEVTFDAIFRRCLEDADDEVRATAIEGLWENESPTLIGPLLTMLEHDPSPQVRAAAAGGLGRFVLAGELEELDRGVEERIVLELLTLFHLETEPTEVRRRSLESAAYACTPEVMDALELAYDDENERMRLSAVLGMGRNCNQKWRPILVRELESRSPAMRYEAALACGELMLRQAVPTLARMIHDPDREVRYASIRALGQIDGEPARQALMRAYHDTDEDTQAAIDDALAEQALLTEEVDMLLLDVDEQPADELEESDGEARENEEEEEETEDVTAWDMDEDLDEPDWDDVNSDDL